MFTCTGSEANDLALRIARRHTGGTGVIVTANAYHGVTASLAELSPSLGPNVPLGRDVRVVPAPAAGVNFTAAVAWAIADLERYGVRLAAFLADSLFSSDGIFPDPAGFLAPVAEITRAAGGLYIADEVQSGFGRTGTHMWGYQRHGVVPDIVTMGKPMGNGLPIAGLVARQDVLEAERLPANAAATGAYLKDGLARLAAGRPVLGEVRGAGLYLGIDVADPMTGAPSGDLAAAIVNGMRERRVLISATGPQGSVLKVRPPLPFGPEHADQFLAALADVTAALG